MQFSYMKAILAMLLLYWSCMANLTHANLIDPFLITGINQLVDDSGELVIRLDLNPESNTFGQYIPLTFGPGVRIQQGDFLLGVFDISWVGNPDSLLEPNLELTGVYFLLVAGITVGTPDDPFETGDIIFAAVDPLISSGLLGVSASAMCTGLTG